MFLIRNFIVDSEVVRISCPPDSNLDGAINILMKINSRRKCQQESMFLIRNFIVDSGVERISGLPDRNLDWRINILMTRMERRRISVRSGMERRNACLVRFLQLFMPLLRQSTFSCSSFPTLLYLDTLNH